MEETLNFRENPLFLVTFSSEAGFGNYFSFLGNGEGWRKRVFRVVLLSVPGMTGQDGTGLFVTSCKTMKDFYFIC